MTTASSDPHKHSESEPRAIVRRLLEADTETLPTNLRAEIWALGPAAAPALIEILSDDDLHSEEAPGCGWAPIHAVDLVGELHLVEAIEPLLVLLPETTFDDVIHGRIIRALQSVGAPALEPVLKAYEQSNVRDVRTDLCCVLSGLAVEDERSFAVLLGELEEDPEIAAGLLAEYGDQRALPALHRAFDRYEVTLDSDHPLAHQGLIEISAAIEDLGGELSAEEKVKFHRAMEPREAWRASLRSALDQGMQSRGTATPGRQKLGRNDPCPCGSGRKYKKCHLKEDESNRARARAGDTSPLEDAARRPAELEWHRSSNDTLR